MPKIAIQVPVAVDPKIVEFLKKLAKDKGGQIQNKPGVGIMLVHHTNDAFGKISNDLSQIELWLNHIPTWIYQLAEAIEKEKQIEVTISPRQ